MRFTIVPDISTPLAEAHFGQPGVRDPEFPCRGFEPGEPSGDCKTDGHYMCQECQRCEAKRPCELCDKPFAYDELELVEGLLICSDCQYAVID